MSRDRRPVRSLLVLLASLALLSIGAAAFVVLQSKEVRPVRSEPEGVEESARPNLVRRFRAQAVTTELADEEMMPATKKELQLQHSRGSHAISAPYRAGGALTPPPASVPGVGEPPAVVAVRRTLEPLVARNPDMKLAFVDCVQEPCTARVDGRSLSAVHAFLQDASAAYSGHMRIAVKERLDAFTGRWFEARLEIGTAEALPVPSLTQELAHLHD